TSCGPASTLRPAAVIDGRKSHTQGRASAHIQPTTCRSAALDNTPARTRGFGANWPTGQANSSTKLLGYWAVGLLAVSPFSRCVGTHRAQEVYVPEGRPEGIAEVNTRVYALPQQKSRPSLFAGGPNEQIRVGLPLGVKVRGDVVGVQAGGYLFK